MLVLALLTDSHSDNIANGMIFSLYCKCGGMGYFGVFLVRDPVRDSRCVDNEIRIFTASTRQPYFCSPSGTTNFSYLSGAFIMLLWCCTSRSQNHEVVSEASQSAALEELLVSHS